jgi:hypothetical protein
VAALIIACGGGGGDAVGGFGESVSVCEWEDGKCECEEEEFDEGE